MNTRWAASTATFLRTAAAIRERHFHGGKLLSGERIGLAFISLPLSTRGFRRHVKPVCALEEFVSMIQQKNAQNSVIVYSRSWCPFCNDMQQLLNSYKIEAKFVELDNIVEGDNIQDTLASMTGSSTVPQLFIGGKFIGGFDDTYALHQQGKLKSLLEGAGGNSFE